MEVVGDSNRMSDVTLHTCIRPRGHVDKLEVGRLRGDIADVSSSPVRSFGVLLESLGRLERLLATTRLRVRVSRDSQRLEFCQYPKPY